MYSKLTDEELVRQIVKNKDPKLFKLLYDRYEKLVHSKCYAFSRNNLEAEDLTQDIFIKLFIKLKSFKFKSKFSTWLYAFTYNFCVNYYRNKRSKRNRFRTISLDHMGDYLYSIDNVLDVNDVPEEKNILAALNAMDKDKRELLKLKYCDFLTIKELTSLYNISESAVKMRLKRARASLTQMIENKNYLKLKKES